MMDVLNVCVGVCVCVCVLEVERGRMDGHKVGGEWVAGVQ